MEYNLSLSAMINAAGALLFLFEGIAILLLSRGSRRGFWIGAAAATFGLTFIVENVIDYLGRGTIEAWVVGGVMALAVLPIIQLARVLATESGPSVSRSLNWILVALGLASLVATWVAVTDPEIADANGITPEPVGAFVLAVRLALMVGLVGFLFAAVRRFVASKHEGNRRAMAGLTLSLGLFTMFWICGNAAAPTPLDETGGLVLGISIMAFAVVALWAILPLLFTQGPTARLARWSFAALLLAGFLAIPVLLAVGLDYAAASAGFGIFGITRSVGAVFLARAVLRHDLLGMPLPTVAVRRGAIATGALATLFIVAQVAQNFLSSEYGLITGGIVAGAFLFAAQPLQRAMENIMSRGASKASLPFPAGRLAENERVYQLAMKKFTADGRITTEEELALAHLADALGLTTRRAMELRLELNSKRGR